MTLIEACKRAMEELGRPATAKEIYNYIVDKNYFIFKTKTPQASVSGALSNLTNEKERVYDENIVCIKENELNTYFLSYIKTEKENTGSQEHNVLEYQFLNPKNIKIEVKPMVIYNIISRIKNKTINLTPAYQRASHLWDNEKKSRLIESILLTFPLPAFYFVEDENGVYEVVDGLQRISAISHFILGRDNDFLELEGLEYLGEILEGKTFKQLKTDKSTKNFCTRIEEFAITAYVIGVNTPDEVKFNLFKRINTGGLALTSQEIRHALNTKKASDFVNKLANLEQFLKTTNSAISSERMEDCDYITRFLAFYLLPHNEYSADMDDFLNKVMKKISQTDETVLKQIETIFEQTLQTIDVIFGDYAFRKRFSVSEKKRNPLNKALFEVLTVCFAHISQTEREKIVQQKAKFNYLFVELFADNEGTKNFTYSITTGTGHKQNVLTRYEKINEIINKTLLL